MGLVLSIESSIWVQVRILHSFLALSIVRRLLLLSPLHELLATFFHLLLPNFLLLGLHFGLLCQKRVKLQSIDKEDDSRVKEEGWSARVVVSLELYDVLVSCISVV